MDTPTLPINKPSGVYVQMPPNLQHVLDFDKYLLKNNWKRKKFGIYYREQTKELKTALELYPHFRNINNAVTPPATKWLAERVIDAYY